MLISDTSKLKEHRLIHCEEVRKFSVFTLNLNYEFSFWETWNLFLCCWLFFWNFNIIVSSILDKTIYPKRIPSIAVQQSMLSEREISVTHSWTVINFSVTLVNLRSHALNIEIIKGWFSLAHKHTHNYISIRLVRTAAK